MYIVFTAKKRKIISIFFVLTALILTLTFCFSFQKNVFSFSRKKELPIYYVETDEKVLAISFDCAWGTDYTDKLLEVMEEEKVRCTFFMVEFWVKKYPEYVKKISDMGHEIGTHSATHPYMSKLSKEKIAKELSTSSSLIEGIINKKVTLFRPPYGDYSDTLIQTAKEMGIYTIQWDVDSLDWKDLSAREIQSRVTSKVKKGSIVLFHNQGLHTHEALKGIITTLKSQGYAFKPIGEMIYLEDYEMSHDGGQRKINKA